MTTCLRLNRLESNLLTNVVSPSANNTTNDNGSVDSDNNRSMWFNAASINSSQWIGGFTTNDPLTAFSSKIELKIKKWKLHIFINLFSLFLIVF